jgi:uncharacterized protein (DUF433 family)/DNA-binding MarR family transcriptional regulator
VEALEYAGREDAVVTTQGRGNVRYAQADARERPRYSIADAARYLQLPVTTLRYWVLGGTYAVGSGRKRSSAIIRRINPNDPRLSFANLVEGHVLMALRREHEVSMRAVRGALLYSERKLRIDRLLLSDELRAAAGGVFLDRLGKLIEISKDGQQALREVLAAHLERVARDVQGLPERLFPITRTDFAGSPKVIVIDPRISFGKPVIASKAIQTHVVADRFAAGESVSGIASDYDIEVSDVEEAIRYTRAA